MKTHLYEKILGFFIFYLLHVGLFLSFISDDLFQNFYAKEDGLIEWSQFAFLFVTALLCFYRVYDLRSFRPKLFLICTFLGGCLFIFGAGEEISWGQRIFERESSEFFQQHNTQGETNIHNLMIGDFRVNKIIFGTGLGIMITIYLLILPWLYRTKGWAKKFIDSLAIPLPQLQHVLGYLLLFLILFSCPSPRKGELLEFGGTGLFLMIFLFPLNNHLYKKN